MKPRTLELLEARIAPAGLVTVTPGIAPGEFTLTGDGADNDVHVFQTGPKTYRIEGIDTDIGAPGTAFLDIGKLTKLTIDGGAGSDQFMLTNLRTLKALSFSGGSGDDRLDAIETTVQGPVDLHGNGGSDGVFFQGLATNISGNIIIDSAPTAADSMDVEFVAVKTVLGGSILFTGGGGSDDYLGANGDGSFSLAKGINFNAGAGGGAIDLSGDGLRKVGKLPTGESILFTGGNGTDTIDFFNGNVTLAGGIRMTGEAGSNSLRFSTAAGVVKLGKLPTGQSILFNGGPGNDSIATATASLALAGGIEFAAGDGNNLIDLLSDNGVVTLGKLAGGQSILFMGGSGSDDVITNTARLTLAGGVELHGAGGDNDLDFADQGVVKIGKFGTGQSILFNGTTNANNEVSLGTVATLAGSVEITGGTGQDRIVVHGKTSIGKNAAGVSVLLNGGDGNDTINFNDVITLAGSVKLDGGLGNDQLEFSSVDSATVKGAVELIGGPGDDSFFLAFNVSAVFGSTLTFIGGEGADTAMIDTDGSIAGAVNIDLGPAVTGTQSVIIKSRTGHVSGLVLKSSLTLDADAANTTADAFTLRNVSVAKLIDLELGGGISTVTIDNLAAGDGFKLNTRGGNDVVNIERGIFFGSSTIQKLAAILTGDGDDQLAIGRPTPVVVVPFPDHTRMIFRAGLTTDGGLAGNDNRNLYENENTFGVAITAPAGFEASTLP